MILEINKKKVNSNDILTDGKSSIMVTPPIGEDYWIYRVKLRNDQAMLGFPKFFQIGIGFAKEEDWNTNLPSNCETEEIYNHIKHNKKHKEITKKQCIEAIDMIKDAAAKSEE